MPEALVFINHVLLHLRRPLSISFFSVEGCVFLVLSFGLKLRNFILVFSDTEQLIFAVEVLALE